MRPERKTWNFKPSGDMRLGRLTLREPKFENPICRKTFFRQREAPLKKSGVNVYLRLAGSSKTLFGGVEISGSSDTIEYISESPSQVSSPIRSPVAIEIYAL